MSIFKYSINIQLISKPRGQRGKYGNITHSVGNYRYWQKEFNNRLLNLKFSYGNPFYIAVIFYIKPKPGQQPDLTNMMGAVEDTLVKFKHIKDDNWKILPRMILEAVKSSSSSISVYIIETESDFVRFCTNRKKILEKT